MFYQWNFQALLPYWNLWVRGFVYTISLSMPVIVAGTIFGGVLVIGAQSPWWLARQLARGYIDLFRAIPALVLIGTLYFCLPYLIGIRITPFQTALIALTLN